MPLVPCLIVKTMEWHEFACHCCFVKSHVLGLVVIVLFSKTTEPGFHFLYDARVIPETCFPPTDVHPLVNDASSYCGIGRDHGFGTPAFGLQALLSGLVALSGNICRRQRGWFLCWSAIGCVHQMRSSRSPELQGLRGALGVQEYVVVSASSVNRAWSCPHPLSDTVWVSQSDPMSADLCVPSIQ